MSQHDARLRLPVQGRSNCLGQSVVVSLHIPLAQLLPGGFDGDATICDRTPQSPCRFVEQGLGACHRWAVSRHDENFAIVPDRISILDRETAEPITTEALKYVQRVRVVGASVPPIMRSERALEGWGPRAFGFDETFVAIEESA